MSQQPPYGEPPQPGQQPGQQRWTPYGPGGAYPDPYAGMPPRPKSNTTRNVLLVVGGLVLLFCGGVFGALQGVRLGPVAPVGGSLLIGGWLLLLLAALRR